MREGWSVKTGFAILFSVLLVWTQTALPGEAAAARPQPKCTRCACGGKCCVGRTAPASAPLPATPASTLSLKQSQLALVIAAQILSPPVSLVTKISPGYFP